jgi:alpha/beta superfamily hydrolase
VASPLRAERLVVAGPAGGLETLLEEPSGHSAARFGVVCHPHPLHGGTLDNKVVHTLARSLHALGIPTVRFNFRGVGASAGAFAEGVGETADALALVQFGRARWPDARAWLLGFSFGAIVAIRAAAEANPERLVAVAPAIGRMPLPEMRPTCPWLIVQGDADEVVEPRAVLEWARRLQPAPAVAVLGGAGHFFHGRLGELREAVAGLALNIIFSPVNGLTPSRALVAGFLTTFIFSRPGIVKRPLPRRLFLITPPRESKTPPTCLRDSPVSLEIWVRISDLVGAPPFFAMF